MGAEITLQQLDQAIGVIIQASERTPMIRADHNAVMQAIQIAVQYIQQERTKKPMEVVKE